MQYTIMINGPAPFWGITQSTFVIPYRRYEQQMRHVFKGQ